MQRKFVIECTLDVRDRNKYEPFADVCRQVAVQLHATMTLLADQDHKPKTECYSDDFYFGKRDIDMLAAKGTPISPLAETPEEEEDLSDELREALRGMR